MRTRSSWTRAMRAASLLALAVIPISAAGLFVLASPTTNLPSEGVLFKVERGESAIDVTRRLEETGIIRSSMLLRLMMKIFGQESSIKAGTYAVKPEMWADDILAMLIQGRQELIRITVPEGYTLRKTAMLLAANKIVEYNAFMKVATSSSILERLDLVGPSLEGYLFPETYMMAPDQAPESVAATMVDIFKSRIAELPETAHLSTEEIFEKLVVASIIEREYRSKEEAPLIASVFDNRLRIGMALQSCATVEYVLTERRGKPHPKRIFDRDIQIEDPYNTYSQKGLPPGPICSPGMIALTASMRPARTDYLYFRLQDGDEGKHAFSKSLDEHQRAGALSAKKAAGE